MFDFVCFLIGVILFAAAIIAGVLFRYDTKKCASIISVGILFSTFALVLPTFNIGLGLGSVTDVAYRILSSMIYSFKSLSGGQTLSQINSIELTGVARYVYFYLCFTMFFIAPVMLSTLLVSFFADTGEKIRYAMHISKRCYVFSSLNDNSLSIAKGIKKNDRLSAIVFCNTRESEKSLILKAKKLGGICFHKSCVDFGISFFHKEYEFYLISENKDENIKDACELIEKNKTKKKGKLTINAFAQSGVGIDIVESKNNENIKVRFVDEVALLCNQVIFKYPLYNISNESKDISVAIIGCGSTGIQMLKTVAWCGQIDGYSLKIRVYDNKVRVAENSFYGQAPELKSSEYDIEFVETDILSEDFENDVLKNSKDATFVFIATGDDEMNLQTAVKLRGAFRRKTQRYDMNPMILTRIRDNTMFENILSSTYLKQRNIAAFGNANTLFEESFLFESELEKLAFGVHLAYKNMLECLKNKKVLQISKKKFVNSKLEKFISAGNVSKKEIKEKKAALKQKYEKNINDFYTQEYNRRSSMATALHIASKLRSVDVDVTRLDFAAESFNDMLLGEKGEEIVEKLAKNEHTRWNAFFRSEGYHSADIEIVKKYYTVQSDSHKDLLSKSHPCIMEWEGLDELMKEYNKHANKEIKVYNASLQEGETEKELHDENESFTKYDRDIIKAIPAILRFVYQKNKKEKANV